jgi:hypothetical protein
MSQWWWLAAQPTNQTTHLADGMPLDILPRIHSVVINRSTPQGQAGIRQSLSLERPISGWKSAIRQIIATLPRYRNGADHARDQNNQSIKGQGGAQGAVQNPQLHQSAIKQSACMFPLIRLPFPTPCALLLTSRSMLRRCIPSWHVHVLSGCCKMCEGSWRFDSPVMRTCQPGSL